MHFTSPKFPHELNILLNSYDVMEQFSMSEGVNCPALLRGIDAKYPAELLHFRCFFLLSTAVHEVLFNESPIK